MRNRIKAKLNSRRGVSILFALSFLLLVSFVTVTILNAAVTSAKRVADDRRHTQDYLALRSAAEVFESELKDTTVTLVKTTTDTYHDGIFYDSESYIAPSYSGPLKDAIGTAFSKAYGNETMGIAGTIYESSDSETIVISAGGGAAGDSLKDVNVSFKMLPEAQDGGEGGTREENTYKILATFSLDDDSQLVYLTAVWGTRDENFSGRNDIASNEWMEDPVRVTTETYEEYKQIKWTSYEFSSSAASLIID